MEKILKNIPKEYINEYINVLTKMAVKMYSEPTLYIPKTKDGRPDISKRWYVYFYYRNPLTGKMDKRPIKVYKGLNTLKTISARKKAGKSLVNVVRRILDEGYSPFKEGSAKAPQVGSIKDSFVAALEHKKPFIKETTYNSYQDYLNPFLDWLGKNGLLNAPIILLTRKHVTSYLNYLGRPKPGGRGLMPTSIHNHKANLSALMSQMVKDDIIQDNFIARIPTTKNKPNKNEPFTLEEISRLRKYAKSNEPELYDFLQFIFYSFMRNNEIVRIQVKHINMENRTISIETKREKISRILMVDKLYTMLKEWNIENLPKEYYVFTPNGIPGKWDVSVKTKVDYFGGLFKKARKTLSIPDEKNSYSLRHNAAIDLFTSFVEQGMTEKESIYTLLQITRHKSESALRNYLRDIGAILPKDWSEHYNISF